MASEIARSEKHPNEMHHAYEGENRYLGKRIWWTPTMSKKRHQQHFDGIPRQLRIHPPRNLNLGGIQKGCFQELAWESPHRPLDSKKDPELEELSELLSSMQVSVDRIRNQSATGADSENLTPFHPPNADRGARTHMLHCRSGVQRCCKWRIKFD